MKIIGYLIALLAVLLPHPASAQTAGTSTATAPATIEGSERHTLAASRNRITYQIDIVRVESALVPTPADYRLPVIYVLDGNSLFSLAAQAASSMVAFGRMPGALVVGIGYPVDRAATRTQSLQNRLAWRTRDLTPAVPGQPGDVPSAAQFLMFIEQDLKPFIASRYAVDPSEQTLAGHSLGGLFAAWTLMNAPDSFSRYVLSSPSLFWNNDALIKQAATFAGRPAGRARVFVSVGDMETKERAGQDMVPVARGFAEALGRRSSAGVNIDVTLHVFPGESHISVVPGALMRGLSQVGAIGR